MQDFAKSANAGPKACFLLISLYELSTCLLDDIYITSKSTTVKGLLVQLVHVHRRRHESRTFRYLINRPPTQRGYASSQRVLRTD